MSLLTRHEAPLFLRFICVNCGCDSDRAYHPWRPAGAPSSCKSRGICECHGNRPARYALVDLRLLQSRPLESMQWRTA